MNSGWFFVWITLLANPNGGPVSQVGTVSTGTWERCQQIGRSFLDMPAEHRAPGELARRYICVHVP